jgi:hypothetical protein
MVESKKYRRDPITIREVLLDDHSLSPILLEPVSPGHEAAELNLAILGQGRVPHRTDVAELL